VTAQGRVREVAPRADAVTGTIRVRVGLIDPPAEMRLGSTVTGGCIRRRGRDRAARQRADLGRRRAGGLGGRSRQQHGGAAPDGVARFNPATVSVEYGLEIGEMVVTAGVQALRPGQEVRLLGDGS
jgi:membrane fusion protein, multidrug efflux system